MFVPMFGQLGASRQIQRERDGLEDSSSAQVDASMSDAAPVPTNRSHLTHVACVGDSLTEGYQTMTWLPLQSYPVQLQAMLGPSYVVEEHAIRLSSALTGEHTHCRSWAPRCMRGIRSRAWDVYVVMLGTNDVISRRCDAMAPKCVPEFSAASGDPCRHGAQTNESPVRSPYEASLLSLIAAFRANNRAHKSQEPRILLVVPPPLLANIGNHTPGCTVAPHPLNATAAMIYLPTSIHAVAMADGNVSVVNPFRLTPCRASASRGRICIGRICMARDSSDLVNVQAHCRYFLHETPYHASSARLTARFGDVVWAADAGNIVGGPILNRESFDMDGIHLNSIGYGKIASEVYSALTPKLFGQKSPCHDGDTCSSGGVAHSQTACAQPSNESQAARLLCSMIYIPKQNAPTLR